MDSAPLATNPRDIRDFIDAIFRYADADSYAVLCEFEQNVRKDRKDRKERPVKIVEPVRVGDLAAPADRAVEMAQQAAGRGTPTVLCMPIATFVTDGGAATGNMANGVAITVDVDNADPREARRRLTALLGEPTVVVNSGSVWECPTTHERAPKIHMHWRLNETTTTPAEHAKLHEARKLAAILVGADKGLASSVHPIRVPGSLNRKGNPVLAAIDTIDASLEVDLDESLRRLRGAVEAMGARLEAAASARRRATGPALSDSDRVKRAVSALGCVPNDDLSRDEWVRVGYAMFDATSGASEGLDAFIAFSAQSAKHHNAATVERVWNSFHKSPPTKITEATLYMQAYANGWLGWMPDAPETPDGYMDAVMQDERARANTKTRTNQELRDRGRDSPDHDSSQHAAADDAAFRFH